MDVDVVLKEPLGNIVSHSEDKEFKADFLYHFIYDIVDGKALNFTNNDFFASVKNSLFISKMLDEAIYPYLETKDNPDSGMYNNTASIIKLAEKFQKKIVPEKTAEILSDDIHRKQNFIDVMWEGKRSLP
ncbi:hypothetical protein [Sodalis sp. dw_96]|uniref:hypothetical protein n=1 Tax=Sodalis sp. dw_96 TaxID=2719794 RepID=UPI001BD3B3B2|nr:hypothetical protein [Sodalis sp. dw_96]